MKIKLLLLNHHNPKTLKRFIIFFSYLFLLGTNTNGQPSYRTDFLFKIYDKNGTILDYKTFCKDYELLGLDNRGDQTPCTNEYISKKSFFNDSTKFFNGGGTIVYNDLVRKFVYKNDTMTLILATAGGGYHKFQIDSIIFKEGVYYIKDNYLSHINFRQAEVDYYNYILNRVITSNNNQYALDKLNQLRQKYGIDKDDYEEKKIIDLNNKPRRKIRKKNKHP